MWWWENLLGRWRPAHAERAGAEVPAFPIERYPPIEAGRTFIAIGDVHGRADLLQTLFARIDTMAEAMGAAPIEVYLGDYVDRGPASATVLTLLARRARQRATIVTLRGNHEVMFLRALEDDEAFLAWLDTGGQSTLRSYGVDPEAWAGEPHRGRALLAKAVPDDHRAFLSGLATQWRGGPYLCVHAGIRPGLALDQQVEDDLLWIREPFLSFAGDHGVIVVHGHSPARTVQLRPNRIGLDTGAFHTGRLTGVVVGAEGARLIEVRG